MAMPQRDETIEEIKRLEPPSPRLRPPLKLRHDKSAGQARCLNTPSCMMTKPRLPASAPSWRNWWRRCSVVGLLRSRLDSARDEGVAATQGTPRRICRGFTKLLHDLHVLHG